MKTFIILLALSLLMVSCTEKNNPIVEEKFIIVHDTISLADYYGTWFHDDSSFVKVFNFYEPDSVKVFYLDRDGYFDTLFAKGIYFIQYGGKGISYMDVSPDGEFHISIQEANVNWNIIDSVNTSIVISDVWDFITVEDTLFDISNNNDTMKYLKTPITIDSLVNYYSN